MVFPLSPIGRYTGHTADVVKAVPLKRNASQFVTGSADSSMKIWDLTYMNIVSTVIFDDGAVSDFDLSDESGLISTEKSVFFTDLNRSGDSIRICNSGCDAVWLNSDATFVCASGSSFELIDLRMGLPIYKVHAHSASITSVTSSTDGSVLVTTSLDGSTRLWDTTNGECVASFGTPTKQFSLFSMFLDTGSLAVLSDDNIIRVWNLRDGSIIQKFSGIKSATNSKNFCIQVKGCFVPTSGGFIEYHDLGGSRTIMSRRAHIDDVTYISVIGDMLLTCGAGLDSSIVLWDSKSLDENEMVYSEVDPQVVGL